MINQILDENYWTELNERLDWIPPIWLPVDRLWTNDEILSYCQENLSILKEEMIFFISCWDALLNTEQRDLFENYLVGLDKENNLELIFLIFIEYKNAGLDAYSYTLKVVNQLQEAS